MLQILRNVLITLYQHVGASLVMTILLMFTYMFIKENGVRKALFTWIQNFKTNREFRKFFGKRLIFRYDRKNPRLLFSSRSTLTVHI